MNYLNVYNGLYQANKTLLKRYTKEMAFVDIDTNMTLFCKDNVIKSFDICASCRCSNIGYSSANKLDWMRFTMLDE